MKLVNSSTYRVGIIGSRRRNTHQDKLTVEAALIPHIKKCCKLVSGGCPKGADSFAEEFAVNTNYQ